MQHYSAQEFANILKTTSFSDHRTRTMKPGADGTISVNISMLGATEKALAKAAMAEISTITGLRFSETTGSAKITFRNDGTGANTKASGSGDSITAATVNIASSRVTAGDGPGDYSFRTYMHEIGHALGLGHPQDYGLIKQFSQSAIANDSWQLSMMSYFDQIENTEIDASLAYHLTPMVSDYLALRQMYGAPAIRAGNTVYGVGSTAGGALDKIIELGATVTYLIADSSGLDKLDFSAATVAQRIDLAAGALSDVMGAVGNLQIAPDALIEHATGGSANDSLTGNQTANTLIGNDGNDTLRGLAGHDLLDGGAGNDLLVGGSGNDQYFTDAGDRVIEAVDGGWDTIRTKLDTVLGANIEELIMLWPATKGFGNALDNRIIGNARDNTLDGRAGNDTLDGYDGTDTALFLGTAAVTVDLTLRGPQNTGHGLDTLLRIENVTSGSGNDRLTGTTGANVLSSGEGHDVLIGGGGADRLIGGAGNDRYVTDGGDQIVEAAGGGFDTVQSSASHVLAANVEWLVLTGTAAINGQGNALNNRITGNGGANGLVGGEGHDQLFAGAGADRLYGGAGRDLLDAGAADAAKDTFIYRGLSDSTPGSLRDIIRNFESGIDVIDLRAIDANGMLAGDQAFAMGGTTPAAHSVWQVALGTGMLLRADVNGDSIADFEIQIDGGVTLQAADLLL